MMMCGPWLTLQSCSEQGLGPAGQLQQYSSTVTEEMGGGDIGLRKKMFENKSHGDTQYTYIRTYATTRLN